LYPRDERYRDAMVYRFRCRQCSYRVWSPDRGVIVDAVGSHVLDHHRQRLTEQGFRTRWDCPFCDRTEERATRDDAADRFERHLFEHVEALVASGAHVADEVDGAGNVLVRSSGGGRGADNARTHFCSPAEVVLFVTTAPGERLRLLDETLPEWPEQTVVLTTKSDPLASVSGIDLSAIGLEVVQLDRSLGLSGVGETISRIVDEYEGTDGRLTVGFDVLSELVAKFDLQTVFNFLHVLGRRFNRADALAHYHVDPRAQSASTINVLEGAFDLSITARDGRFVAGGRTDAG
jgi:hypothetical protein